MVKIGLQIKAFLENVTGLIPDDIPNFQWHLKIKVRKSQKQFSLASDLPLLDLLKKIPPNYYTNLGVTNQNYIDPYIFFYLTHFSV